MHTVTLTFKRNQAVEWVLITNSDINSRIEPWTDFICLKNNKLYLWSKDEKPIFNRIPRIGETILVDVQTLDIDGDEKGFFSQDDIHLTVIDVIHEVSINRESSEITLHCEPKIK